MVKAPKTITTETDTYTPMERNQKERLDPTLIQEHWRLRAKREGLQAVMSARHTIEENEQASYLLQDEIFRFLKGYVEGKQVFELGVGVGRMTEELAKRAAYVTGCDLTPEMIERAKIRLRKYDNVFLHVGRITDIPLPRERYDLVFDSIVLLHILDPIELRKTADKMMELSEKIFLVEHTDEGPGFPISKYSILRTAEEYETLFRPYTLVQQQEHLCAGDRFTMMLFEK